MKDDKGVLCRLSVFDFYGIMLNKWCEELARAWKSEDKDRIKYCRMMIHEYEKEVQELSMLY